MRTMDDSLVEMGMKDHPAGSKKLDTDAIEDPKLVGMVEKRMANLNLLTGHVPGKNPAAFDDDDDDSTPDDVVGDVKDDDVDDDVDDDIDDDVDVDDDDQAVSDDGDAEPTPEEKDKDGDKEEKGISDAYIRAAIHNGWSEEDVENLVKANPEMAAKTFENLYNSTNKASREWAAIGRASRKKADEETRKSAEEKKFEYGGVDIDALKDKFDIDPSVEQLLKNSNAYNEKLVDALNELTKDKIAQQDTSQVDRAARYYDVAAEAAEEQQVNGFFATDSMKPYNKFYGEIAAHQTWEDLPPTQAKHRYAVYQTADQLLAGAAMQSQSMGLGEALERAHLLVTEGMREEVIRSKIKKTATKRKNSMVFRPSESKRKKSGGGKPRTKNELESKVAGFIQKALKA